MANRIVGNVYIIDTGSANIALPWLSGTRISCIAFWSSDTTGTLRLTGSNTTNTIAYFSNPTNVPNTVGAYLGGVNFKEMKVPTLTAGTAFIYMV